MNTMPRHPTSVKLYKKQGSALKLVGTPHHEHSEFCEGQAGVVVTVEHKEAFDFKVIIFV